MVTDYWEGIELFLEPHHEVLVASNGEEVAELLRRTDPATCRAIGVAAKRRVLAEHTYDHRAVQVEQLLTARIASAPSLLR
jgi:spore maturation protein CgeB